MIIIDLEGGWKKKVFHAPIIINGEFVGNKICEIFFQQGFFDGYNFLGDVNGNFNDQNSRHTNF